MERHRTAAAKAGQQRRVHGLNLVGDALQLRISSTARVPVLHPCHECRAARMVSTAEVAVAEAGCAARCFPTRTMRPVVCAAPAPRSGRMVTMRKISSVRTPLSWLQRRPNSFRKTPDPSVRPARSPPHRPAPGDPAPTAPAGKEKT